jgi:hypothetical protein
MYEFDPFEMDDCLLKKKRKKEKAIGTLFE